MQLSGCSPDTPADPPAPQMTIQCAPPPKLGAQAQRTRIWAQVSELRHARPFQNPCPVAIQNGAPAPHASSPLPSPREAGLDPLGEEWRRLCHKLGSPRYGRPSTPAPVRFPSLRPAGVRIPRTTPGWRKQTGAWRAGPRVEWTVSKTSQRAPPTRPPIQGRWPG